MKEHGYVIGIDLGGTKIATALCDNACNIIARVKVNTEAEEGEQEVIRRIGDSIRQVIEISGVPVKQISGIGISSPGPLSIEKGTIIYAALLGWRNVAIRELIQQEFNIATYLENDANAAAYGETLLGAGRGFSNVVYITVSTGIGSGLVINRQIHRGKHDAAGELGHICVELNGRKCSCGNRGCLQAYASGTAIAQIARERALCQKESRILSLADGKIESIDCLTVEKAAYEGDSLVKELWHEAGVSLGQGISIIMQMLDPDIVVIGGGVTKAWKLFYEPMVRVVGQQTYKLISDDMLIVPAQLGEDSGVLGAAMIALTEGGKCQESLFLQQKIS